MILVKSHDLYDRMSMHRERPHGAEPLVVEEKMVRPTNGDLPYVKRALACGCVYHLNQQETESWQARYTDLWIDGELSELLSGSFTQGAKP